MLHFYDGQIRRYLTQIIRMLSDFSYKDIQGNLTKIPVMYGDITRQVGFILKDNSENKIPSAPRMAVYISGLELDRNRLADSSYVNKLNIRERAFDSDNNEYLNTEGKNYTVERLMPTPYTLNLNVDIWSSNTDQKLQILEQILMLFNPSLEIQTTDNYVDWTSLSVVNLESVTFSSRSIPVGNESEIDVATLSFSTPIFISPPTKVKRLGVITSVITSIFDEAKGTIELDSAMPQLKAYTDTSVLKSTAQAKIEIDENGNVVETDYALTTDKTDAGSVIATTYKNYDLYVYNNTAQLISNNAIGAISWTAYLKAFPQVFEAGISQLRLQRSDLSSDVVGTVSVSSLDEYTLTVNWDEDTLPTDTVLSGPTGDKNKINFIIDPLKTNPINLKQTGIRILLLNESIGNADNTNPPTAWKNSNGTNFVAGANDIIEWDGTSWTIVFDASENNNTIIYTTNLNTGIQYKFYQGEWVLAFEGEYPHGTWRIKF